MKSLLKTVALLLGSVVLAGARGGEPVPARLLGTWRVTRIVPTRNKTCWSPVQAQQMLGTTLVYRAHAMRWRGGEVPLQDVFLRQVTAAEFQKENGGAGDDAADFAQLGIRADAVTEVDLQHEDADITGSTTEVPGDTVLLAGPKRIIFSGCHVFFEAVRAGGS
jgi:hypothetical protein